MINDGYKVNIAGVESTSENINKEGVMFGEAVDDLYSIINTAQANAWAGPEAEQYYTSITEYKTDLNKIREEITAWKNRTQKIADNYTEASNKISSEINNL